MTSTPLQAPAEIARSIVEAWFKPAGEVIPISDLMAPIAAALQAERDRHAAELLRIRTAVARAYCILHDAIITDADRAAAAARTMEALRDLHAELHDAPEEASHGQ